MRYGDEVGSLAEAEADPAEEATEDLEAPRRPALAEEEAAEAVDSFWAADDEARGSDLEQTKKRA